MARGVTYVQDNLGSGTNTDAEWLALIHALEVAQALGEPRFELIGDARVVVDQANRVARCRTEALQAHLERFTALAERTPPVHIRWIGRAQNLAGIALAARHER